MTVIVAAPKGPAERVADALTDRTVRSAESIAAARDLLDEIEPTVVLTTARLPDGDGTDLRDAVRSGDRDPPTPVLELVDAEDATDGRTADDVENADGTDDTSDTDGTGDANAATDLGPGAGIEGSTDAFDDRVSLDDPEALRSAVRLAIAIQKYQEATTGLYDLSRRRSDGETVDPAAIDDARRDANDRLTAVQRAAGGRTPFHRLFPE